MQFKSTDVGEYLICAGSIEALLSDGYVAAVVVERNCVDRPGRQEIYRDISISGGHRWVSADEALEHALRLGVVAVERHRSADA
jgi:hypothetical protein